MAGTGELTVYDALIRLKPDDLKPGTWATRAGLARNLFNNLREHNNPKSETIDALLEVIQVSRAEFERLRAPGPLAEGSDGLADPYRAFRGERPRDVPVRGTPSCGEMVVRVDGEKEQVETIDMDLDDAIDFVRRPPSLDGRRDVYAIYPQGHSMAPKFEPGDIAYVDARKPAAIGDYVVVQLRKAGGEGGDRIVSALLKRLVRRSADWIELEQFNPPLIFRIEQKRVAATHRIIPLAELAGV